ncbi:MAG: hypothetical protein E6J78_12710 [Deltaproteobacteria bacterium]|nr:MAG: hypothetical protein E6J78_12710 [Deltaproteobacteria bacterium]
MKGSARLLLAAILLSTGAYATKVPIPVEGASLNISVQVQPQFLINEASTPDGLNPSFDTFVRRTRLLVNGDINQNFSYLFQVDNANFGKFGNYTTPRAIVQDAWIGWAPTGVTGGTVFYIDAGILLIPISRHMLTSTTNFITADAQTDAFRFPGAAFQAFRDTGVQIRGWALDKKLGWRGGVFEGYTPFLQPAAAAATATNPACVAATPGTCITPKRYPAFRGFVNFQVIGSEEGVWVYGDYKWGKSPVVSVNVAGNYQAQAVRNGFGNLADQRLLAFGAYVNLPMSEAAEFVGEGTLYLNGNGSSSANSGTGISASAGYRFGFIAPYVAYDYFQSTNCDDPGLTNTGGAISQATCDGSNSRNIKGGLNFFFNKNANHLNIEFGVNHGQSAYGPSSVTVASAGYVPLSLDPAPPATTRRAFSNALANPVFKSLLIHWNVLF